MRSWVFVPKQGNLSCPGTWHACCLSFAFAGYFPKVKRFKVLNQYVFTKQDAWQTNCVYTLLDAVAVSSFSIWSPNIETFLNTCGDFRCSMNIFLFRFGVFAQCEIGQSRRHYYPMQGVTELWLRSQSDIRPWQEPISSHQKAAIDLGAKTEGLE